MNDLQIFKSNESGEIRTKMISSEPYFMLSDVCKALEVNSSGMAKNRLNKCGVSSADVTLLDDYTSDGAPAYKKDRADFINKSNLYELVFQGRKPQTEKFNGWVTSEVFPTIRKHRAYVSSDVIEKTLSDPSCLIRLATNLKEERVKRALTEAQIERDKPKVSFADTVSSSNKSCLIGELARLINQEAIRRDEVDKRIGQSNLFAWMRNSGYLYESGERKNQPLQQHVEQGLFKLKKGSYIDSNGSNITTTATKVTGKGRIYFVNKFLGA